MTTNEEEKTFDINDFINDTVLESTTWFYPSFQYLFPEPPRWEYVERCETYLSKLVCSLMDWELLEVTKGFNSKYDAKVNTPFGHLTMEIKMSDRQEIFIEGGRAYRDGWAGLSASEADMYIIMSRKMMRRANGTPYYLGKVRLCLRPLLVDKYLELAEYREFTYAPSNLGPGSTGVKMSEFELPHIWLGDVECKIDEGGVTRYLFTEFAKKYHQPGRAKAEFAQTYNNIKHRYEKS